MLNATTYLNSLSRFGMKLGLERITGLLTAVGNPHSAFASVHIAGTNGKGSTARMIERILVEAGYRVGLYTSPHLVSYNERMAVDGETIPNRTLNRLSSRIRTIAESSGFVREYGEPTEFEVATAIAFLYFAESGVELAVIEVGLGGRWDATNVVSPVVTAITPVGMDHTDRLGNTLAQIAADKAGILKPGVRCVVGRQALEARSTIEDEGRKVGADLRMFGVDFDVQSVAAGIDGTGFTYTGERILNNLHVPMLGAYQSDNAAVAVALCEALQARGWPVGADAVSRGLAAARWPGRLEIVQSDPPVLLDGAHNPAGAESLKQALLDLFPHHAKCFVMGVLQGKDVESMLESLLPLGRTVIFTQPASSRTPPAQPEVLAQMATEVRRGMDVKTVPYAGGALEQALACVKPWEQPLVVVCGSLYLVGELRPRWRETPGRIF